MTENQPNSDIVLAYEHSVGTSFLDNLTGLANYGLFHLMVEREFERAKRHGAPFTVGLVGIDAFREFNRANGSISGDRFLKEVSCVIREHLRQSDLAGRYSGDTFAILLADTGANGALIPAERIRAAVERLPAGSTVSIGLAEYTSDVFGPEAMLLRAREALLRSKSMGKNRITPYAATAEPASGPHPQVLLVDDEPLNLKLLEGILTSLNIRIRKAASGKEALNILTETEVDLVFLDVMMPDMDGLETCRRIKNNPRHQAIPIILLTALDDMDSKIKGIDAGADDFISKPPNRLELIARTKALLKVKMLNSNLASIENVLFSLARAVEAKDAYTQGHTERVANLSGVVGRRMGLSAEDLKALSYGGIMHDIGKIGIPNDILNKEGPLTKEEREMMQKHPEIGYNICLPLQKNLGLALQVIRSHHEKMDGTGYPDGLKGDEIPTAARIVAVVDIFDALTSDRPYRKAMPKEKGLAILQEEAGGGKLDADVVRELIDYLN